jgi:hypothetical protein
MESPAPDAPFDSFLSLEALTDGRLRAVLPDGWQQGRGLYGGLVCALFVRAMEAATPGRPLRSLTAELCGPVAPGEVTLELATLRAGNAVTTMTVKLLQGGEVQAHGVGVLGRARPVGGDVVALTPPEMAPWREVEVLPVEPPFGPDFARFFEFRSTGPLPLSGGPLAAAEGWIRLKSPGPSRDAALLAAYADSYWPAIYVTESSPRPMATIAFTFQPFARFEGLDPVSPVFLRTRHVATYDGYCVEFREVWGEDGRLLALNQQTFVIIK